MKAKKFLIFGLIVLGLLTLQLSVLPLWLKYVPNILLLFILALSLYDEDRALFGQRLSTEFLGTLALTAGLVLDLFSYAWFGFYITSIVLLVLFFRYLFHNYVEQGINYKSIFTLIFFSTILPVIFQMGQGSLLGWTAFAYVIFFNILALAIISTLVNYLVEE